MKRIKSKRHRVRGEIYDIHIYIYLYLVNSACEIKQCTSPHLAGQNHKQESATLLKWSDLGQNWPLKSDKSGTNSFGVCFHEYEGKVGF